jgi:predicted DNA-binding protein YlxM (UPF0122 family)
MKYEDKILEELIKLNSEMGVLKGQLRGIYTETKRTNGSLNNHDKRLDYIEKELSRKKGFVEGQEQITKKVSTIVSLVVSAIVSIVGMIISSFSQK